MCGGSSTSRCAVSPAPSDKRGASNDSRDGRRGLYDTSCGDAIRKVEWSRIRAEAGAPPRDCPDFRMVKQFSVVARNGVEAHTSTLLGGWRRHRTPALLAPEEQGRGREGATHGGFGHRPWRGGPATEDNDASRSVVALRKVCVATGGPARRSVRWYRRRQRELAKAMLQRKVSKASWRRE